MRVYRSTTAVPVLTIAALCVAAVSTNAQAHRLAAAPSHGEWQEEVEQSRALIDSLMRARNLPGLSIAVSVDGTVVWSEGFGYSDLEQLTPVLPTTKFRIGSISKPITAAAVAQLHEQGRIDLDAPVQQYVPSFPEKANGTVTTRLLAGHLAGVRHYRGEEFLSSRRYDNSLAGLEMFQDDTLQTPPGQAYSYSTFGWNLVSVVVEGASGEDFLSYMMEHVFLPLGMRHTVADHTDSIIVGRTGYYDRTEDGRLINSPYVDNSYKWAGGGFLSTPEDLLRFANAHLESGFLTPETIELLWTSQHTTAGESTGYGIGWNVSDLDGQTVVSHGGGSVGGNSWLGIVPDSRVVLAVTANISGAGYGRVPQRILRLFAGF
jgi:CubicO group peptidase (beta-lactamase class C family)